MEDSEASSSSGLIVWIASEATIGIDSEATIWIDSQGEKTDCSVPASNSKGAEQDRSCNPSQVDGTGR